MQSLVISFLSGETKIFGGFNQMLSFSWNASRTGLPIVIDIDTDKSWTHRTLCDADTADSRFMGAIEFAFD